jgi:hypothetical protein
MKSFWTNILLITTIFLSTEFSLKAQENSAENDTIVDESHPKSSGKSKNFEWLIPGTVLLYPSLKLISNGAQICALEASVSESFENLQKYSEMAEDMMQKMILATKHGESTVQFRVGFYPRWDGTTSLDNFYYKLVKIRQELNPAYWRYRRLILEDALSKAAEARIYLGVRGKNIDALLEAQNYALERVCYLAEMERLCESYPGYVTDLDKIGREETKLANQMKDNLAKSRLQRLAGNLERASSKQRLTQLGSEFLIETEEIRSKGERGTAERVGKLLGKYSKYKSGEGSFFVNTKGALANKAFGWMLFVMDIVGTGAAIACAADHPPALPYLYDLFPPNCNIQFELDTIYRELSQINDEDSLRDLILNYRSNPEIFFPTDSYDIFESPFGMSNFMELIFYYHLKFYADSLYRTRFKKNVLDLPDGYLPALNNEFEINKKKGFNEKLRKSSQDWCNFKTDMNMTQTEIDSAIKIFVGRLVEGSDN